MEEIEFSIGDCLVENSEGYSRSLIIVGNYQPSFDVYDEDAEDTEEVFICLVGGQELHRTRIELISEGWSVRV